LELWKGVSVFLDLFGCPRTNRSNQTRSQMGYITLHCQFPLVAERSHQASLHSTFCWGSLDLSLE
jgi:hypothetical protein